MSVNTKSVTQRREVTFTSYDDLLTDAMQLAAGEVITVRNWSFGQILKHLATAYQG
jgi:hypothetical protein